MFGNHDCSSTSLCHIIDKVDAIILETLKLPGLGTEQSSMIRG